MSSSSRGGGGREPFVVCNVGIYLHKQHGRVLSRQGLSLCTSLFASSACSFDCQLRRHEDPPPAHLTAISLSFIGEHIEEVCGLSVVYSLALLFPTGNYLEHSMTTWRIQKQQYLSSVCMCALTTICPRTTDPGLSLESGPSRL